jgi:hypothetical protein
MNYWLRKIGWYLIGMVNYWTLIKFHELPAIRTFTSLVFMLLGAYWWHGFRDTALREKPL